MKKLHRRKILELISNGSITAKDGLKLLSSLEEKTSEKKILLEINSNRQEIPYFQFSIPVQKLLEQREFFRKLTGINLKGQIQIGGFRIDLTKLNWIRILELAEIEDSEDLYLLEMPGQEDEQLQMRIVLRKE
ncbi:MAG: hypothetical protein K9N06_09370 [Candidatus Cloacimonetes bacterium]|nr:hypothetical protein [Candidatus Cloacimonadota bacterium]